MTSFYLPMTTVSVSLICLLDITSFFLFDPFQSAEAQSEDSAQVKQALLIADEKEVQVAPDNVMHPGGINYNAMVFNGTIPGPIIELDEGDTLEMTFRNEGQVIHSLTLSPEVSPSVSSSGNVSPGESITWEIESVNPGVYLYYSAGDSFNGIWEQIANGMYGVIIVHPSQESPAKEFVVVFSEVYNSADNGLFAGTGGITGSFDIGKFLNDEPDLVLTNGFSHKYLRSIGSETRMVLNSEAEPFRARPGEQTRWHLVNAGPNDMLAFHFIGSQIDGETVIIPPGRGTIIEIVFPEDGIYLGVDHNMNRFLRGGAFAVIVGDIPSEGFMINPRDGFNLLDSVDTISEEIFDASISIDSADITSTSVKTYHVTLSGTIISTPELNPVILVDWNNGSTVTEATLSGQSWSATHTFTSEGHREVIARLMVTGNEISRDTYSINVQPTNQILPDEIIIVLALVTGVAAPVSVVEYKYKPIRKSIEKTKKLPSGFYFKAAIENEKTIKDATAKFAELVEEATDVDEAPHISRNLVDTLSESAGSLKETLCTIKDADEVTSLSTEGHTTPDKLLTGMVNKGFSKMLDSLAPVYGAFFIKEITVNSEVEILKRINEGESRIASDIDIKMEPLFPLIEAGIMVNGLPKKAVSVVFQLDTSANVSQLELKTTSKGKVKINLKDIVVNLQLSLHKISIYGLPFGPGSGGQSILNKPVDLVKKEFRLNSIITRDKEKEREQQTEHIESVAAYTSNNDDAAAIKAKNELQQVYCVVCQKTVEVLRFCPECRIRLLSPT